MRIGASNFGFNVEQNVPLTAAFPITDIRNTQDPEAFLRGLRARFLSFPYTHIFKSDLLENFSELC